MAWSVNANIHKPDDSATIELTNGVTLVVRHLGDFVRVEVDGATLLVSPVAYNVMEIKPHKL